MADPNDVFLNQNKSTLKQNPVNKSLKVEATGISSANDYEIQTLTVGVAEASFPSKTLADVNEILIQAASTNTASVLVGKTGILADLTNGGWELTPASMIPIPTSDFANLKAISLSAGQKLLITYIESSS